jgi:hypothetical protein
MDGVWVFERLICEVQGKVTANARWVLKESRVPMSVVGLKRSGRSESKVQRQVAKAGVDKKIPHRSNEAGHAVSTRPFLLPKQYHLHLQACFQRRDVQRERCFDAETCGISQPFGKFLTG